MNLIHLRVLKTAISDHMKWNRFINTALLQSTEISLTVNMHYDLSHFPCAILASYYGTVCNSHFDSGL